MNFYTIIVDSDWNGSGESREKLWDGYADYPDWLKENIKKDIEECKAGHHNWSWSKDSRETLHGKHEAKCFRRGCNAIATFE